MSRGLDGQERPYQLTPAQRRGLSLGRSPSVAQAWTAESDQRRDIKTCAALLHGSTARIPTGREQQPMRITKTILAAALIAALAAPAIASAATTFSLDVNLASIHTERWARHDLNQRNLGAGITAQLTPNWSVSTGWYRNSYRRGSAYALVNWTPLHWSLPAGWSIAAGATAGLDSGYRTNEIATQPLVAAALVRVIAPAGWAVDLTAVPNASAGRTGFVGAQISLPLSL